jgi:hypothetical protein
MLVTGAAQIEVTACYGLLAAATGYTTKGSKFESRRGKEFLFLHVVQTSSGAHPASYPMGSGGKAAGA